MPFPVFDLYHDLTFCEGMNDLINILSLELHLAKAYKYWLFYIMRHDHQHEAYFQF